MAEVIEIANMAADVNNLNAVLVNSISFILVPFSMILNSALVVGSSIYTSGFGIWIYAVIGELCLSVGIESLQIEQNLEGEVSSR